MEIMVPLILLMKDQGDDCSEQQLQDMLDLKVKLVFGSPEAILNNYRHIVVPPFSASMDFLDDSKLSVTSRIFRTAVSFLTAQFRHKMFVKNEPSPLDISFPAINSRFKQALVFFLATRYRQFSCKIFVRNHFSIE